MNKQELEIIVDEWDNIGKGTKTVPLITLSNEGIEKERRIFSFCSKILKSMINRPDDTGNN
jgi:hypothetical protein